jgi:hypothetical protein
MTGKAGFASSAQAAPMAPIRKASPYSSIIGRLIVRTGRLRYWMIVWQSINELLVQVFGERGIHARSAVSVAQVPFGACVEIDMIAELRATQLGGSNY